MSVMRYSVAEVRHGGKESWRRTGMALGKQLHYIISKTQHCVGMGCFDEGHCRKTQGIGRVSMDGLMCIACTGLSQDDTPVANIVAPLSARRAPVPTTIRQTLCGQIWYCTFTRQVVRAGRRDTSRRYEVVQLINASI